MLYGNNVTSNSNAATGFIHLFDSIHMVGCGGLDILYCTSGSGSSGVQLH